LGAVSLLNMVKFCVANKIGVERISSNVSVFYGAVAESGKGWMGEGL